MLRAYQLECDSGAKPWVTGYARDFRWTPVGSQVAAHSRKIAVARLREEYEEDIRDSGGVCRVVCLGRIAGERVR